MPDTGLQATKQSLEPGVLVELFILDASKIVGSESISYFVSKAKANASVNFGGKSFVPIDIEVKGFEWNSRDKFPRPKIRISNVNRFGGRLLEQYKDLVGAKLTRMRTFSQFLDDGEDPDFESRFPDDLFYVDKKISQNPIFIEWELVSSVDQAGRLLPRRQALQDYCSHTYRRWNPETEEFEYDGVSCPYVGTRYYNLVDNEVLDPAQDSCAKHLSSCRRRFANSATGFGQFAAGKGVLPLRSFPNMGRLRTR